jgi:hypothetical protein
MFRNKWLGRWSTQRTNFAAGWVKQNSAIFCHDYIKNGDERPHVLEIREMASGDEQRTHVCGSELNQSKLGRFIYHCVSSDGPVKVSGQSTPFHKHGIVPRAKTAPSRTA